MFSYLHYHQIHSLYNGVFEQLLCKNNNNKNNNKQFFLRPSLCLALKKKKKKEKNYNELFTFIRAILL
jgi:hypothetical protein